MLTNPQREHFGLRPIEAGWEPVSLKDLVLYYDGDVIRKVICYEHGKQFGYSEFDYDLRTESRARLMPTTPRGKPKPLTPSNILAHKRLGFSFVCRFGWEGKSFAFRHLYVTHNPTCEQLVALDSHEITSYELLAAWVEDFVRYCPPNHLQRIDELLGKKPVRVRYKPGDAFEIRFDGGDVGYGRILLDIFRLRRAGLFERVPHCGLGGSILGSGLLVVLYRYAGPPVGTDQIAALPTLGTLMMMHDDIYRGRFPITGHTPVSETELDFPEGVINWYPGDGTGGKYYFDKGGMEADLQMTSDEYERVPKVGCTFGLVPAWVRDAIHGDSEALGRLLGDLRFSEQRPGILHRCGLDCTMSYSEMVAAKGGISPYELLRTTAEIYSGRMK